VPIPALRPLVLLTFLLAAALALGPAPAEGEVDVRWSYELKTRFRASDDAAFRLNFPFRPDQIPAGQSGVYLRNVDSDDSIELVTGTVGLDVEWASGALGVRLDAVDLDDRNPTSSAEAFDVDEAWVRLGRETETAVPPDGLGGYAKIGKFPRFERQDDRHLESYGLATTTFNRLEDVGVEVGFDLGRYFFIKGSFTQGNPVFMRDPNALAGDNGTPEFQRPNPEPEFESGIVFPYDADVHEVDFEHPETAIGLGFRVTDSVGNRGGELILWGAQRDLAETVEIDGSFYGGDLDLLRGPNNLFEFAITDDRKEEVGASFWLYLDSFSLFALFVDQELAGLDRQASEIEVAWRFELSPRWAIRGSQVLPSIAPAVRYSTLDPDFPAPPITPTPSFTWPWEKWDYGIRLGLFDRTDLTFEYTDNTFTLASGRDVGLDELLLTLRLRFDT